MKTIESFGDSINKPLKEVKSTFARVNNRNSNQSVRNESIIIIQRVQNHEIKEDSVNNLHRV